MVVSLLGRSLQNFSCSFDTYPLASLFVHLSRYRMASSTQFERMKARAEQTDKILADLQAKIDVIKKSAVKQAGLEEEDKLIKENEELRREIEAVRKDLILTEIQNGVRQVPVPTKGQLLAITTALTAPPSSTPLVNGTAEEVSAKPKEMKEVGEKKTKPADQQAAGGKKIKIENKGKEGKADGEGKSKKAASAGEGGDSAMDVSRLDLRVGKIVAVDKHPDADTLYVEQVDLGEGRNRTVVSGLAKHFPLNAMKDRIAVFMCNLKPSKIRGIQSEAMIMCAVVPEKTEILVPPTDSVIGDRVIVEEYPGTPDEQLNPKKKIWETLKPDIRTNNDRIATFKGAHWIIPGKGAVLAPTLGDAQIS